MIRAFGSLAANTPDQEIVPAASVAGKKVVVHAIFLLAGGTGVSVTFKSKVVGGASTAISPAFPLAANGGFVLPPVDPGWCETTTGEKLDADVGAGSAVSYIIFYSLRG